MDKRVTMQARFDVQTITGEPLKDLLNDEIHYVDIGPFEIETGGRLIPFDFESISIDFDNDSACIFCCFTGLEERMSDVDMHHEVSWAAAGLERKDITAALLADADALTKFHFAAGGYGIPRIPCSLKLKDMTFTDERDKTYSVKHDILEEFNTNYLAEQYAKFLCKYGEFEFDTETIATVTDLIADSMDSISPYSTINLINCAQGCCSRPDIKEHADFLADQLISNSRSKDSIYRVSLAGCSEIADLPIKGRYCYADTLEKCQTAVSQYIEANSLGARSFAGGFVYRGNEYVGQISYNGRFWDKEHKYGSLKTYIDTPALALERKLQTNMPILRKCLDDECSRGMINQSKEGLDERINKVRTGEGKEIDIGNDRERYGELGGDDVIEEQRIFI